MDASFYLSPFLIAFFLSIACIVLVQIIFWRIRPKEARHGARHDHKRGILRFGGAALVISFLVTLFLNSHLVLTTSWWGVISISMLILIVGLLDDMKEISWKSQLMAQMLAGAVAFAFGIRILSLTNPFGEAIFFDAGWMLGVSFIVTVAWIIVVMNAVNWADGIDGLCGGIAFIGFSTVFLLSLRPEVNQPPVAIFSLALAGASLGFLLFNFYPARIFAGTSGSWFLGFMLAVLALFSGTKIATAVLVLALPLLDAVWVVFDRLRSGVSIFAADTRHLHHRLRGIGWSSLSITLFLYGITIIIAAIALHADALEKLMTLAGLIVLTGIFFFWIERQSK
ncbi:MAG: MraY family glycosyltransferase [Candidatus Moranbacteria bacterium]|nr:MraY family glycosyltransferase [Candidatus Moranbacteria bacterium]